MRLFLLLPLTLAACLQVDPASQEASENINIHFLKIADKQVVVRTRAAHGNNMPVFADQVAITSMEFAERKHTFGSSVKLEKDKPLKDKTPLVFSKIVFGFHTVNEIYNCVLGGKNDSEIELLRMMPFSLNQCENQQPTAAKDPLAAVFKKTGLIYKGADRIDDYGVEKVNWNPDTNTLGKNYIAHHYTYEEEEEEDGNCKLDIWIDGEKIVKGNNRKPPEYTGNGAVGYLMTHPNFISKTDRNIVISGQYGNILIKCGKNGFAYFSSNDEENQPLFTPQMAGGESYNPTGNSHLYFSGKDEGTLTIVAALRYSTGLKVTPTVTSAEGKSVMGREARIYTAKYNGVIEEVINEEAGTRTIVVPIPVVL